MCCMEQENLSKAKRVIFPARRVKLKVVLITILSYVDKIEVRDIHKLLIANGLIIVGLVASFESIVVCQSMI